MKHPFCQTEDCDHAWNVHAPNDGKCRVTSCDCPAYREVAAPKTPTANRTETFEEAARRVEAGQIVVLVPGPPDSLPAMALAILRQIMGTPQPNDPQVALVCVEQEK